MASKEQVLGALAANVRTLRQGAGLTQADLAEAADLSVVHMQRIERGIVDARISTLVSLAEALETSPDVLLREADALDRPVGRPRKSDAQ